MTQTFYKLDIQGIVYLVDPETAIAYTYDLTEPTAIGKLVWTDINAAPQIDLYPDWQEILRSKLATDGATE